MEVFVDSILPDMYTFLPSGKLFGSNQNRVPNTVTWDHFDVWALSERQLCNVLWDIFCDTNMVQEFSIPKNKFFRFLDVIRQVSHKRELPYHNFRHFTDVTQTAYFFLKSGAFPIFSPLEILGLLLSCLLHDLDHPGFTNSFLLKIQSPLINQYCSSQLENHHITEALKLLDRKDCNILEGLRFEQNVKLRDNIQKFILATDLALHRHFLDTWESCQSNFNKEDESHRILFAQILLKSADISNPVKRFDIARRWAVQIQEEFFLQGDEEKKRNLPVSPFMDRNSPGLPAMQINFISGIVEALFRSLSQVLPSTQVLVKKLEANLDTWRSIQSE
jgi:high affinity cGMP-specific 3',5'-cyclic phosphodiesterase 9